MEINLYNFNYIDTDYPLHRCLHAFIEEQVSKTPSAVALTYEGESLT